MNTAKKITEPDTTIDSVTSTFAGVHETNVHAMPSTTTAWNTRANLRSANSSAHTCVSRGSGLRNIESRRPVRIIWPSRSMRPTTRSAAARPNPVAPYRKAISERLQPPSESMVWNMIQMPTKSSRPIAKPLTAIIQNDAGYAIAARVHIRAMSR